jgi:hypothetical protein
MKATRAAEIHNAHIYGIIEERDELRTQNTDLLRTALCIKEARCFTCAHRGHCNLEYDTEYLLCEHEYTNKFEAEHLDQLILQAQVEEANRTADLLVVDIERLKAELTELLAACEAARDWVGFDGDGISNPILSQLKTAITHVKGETS